MSNAHFAPYVATENGGFYLDRQGNWRDSNNNSTSDLAQPDFSFTQVDAIDRAQKAIDGGEFSVRGAEAQAWALEP
jgi:hypothetical protein